MGEGAPEHAAGEAWRQGAFPYNAAADRRSWAAMLSLFEEAFGAR
jgi:hypothetical protein